MPPRLVPLTRDAAPMIPVQRPVILIGRHSDCDVQIDRPAISRRHCCLALAYDRLLIRDLGSRNGVRVNGLVVDEAQLTTGDEVAIGPLLYRLEVAAPVSSPTPVPRPQAAPPSPADPDPDLIPL